MVYYKFSPIVLNPAWKEKTPEYACSLRDRDNARQSSIKIGINPLGEIGDVIPKDKVVSVRGCEYYIVKPGYRR